MVSSKKVSRSARSKREGRGLRNCGDPPGQTADRGLGAPSASTFALRPVCIHERMAAAWYLGALVLYPDLRTAVAALDAEGLRQLDHVALKMRAHRAERRARGQGKAVRPGGSPPPGSGAEPRRIVVEHCGQPARPAKRVPGWVCVVCSALFREKA